MCPMQPTAVHPELRSLSRILPRGATARSLRVARRVGDAGDRLGALRRRNSPEVVRLRACTARVHRPPSWRNGPHPALVWIHGGGFVMGAASQEDQLCRKIAAELGAVVVAVDYRRAPEHPFPAPLEDCHDALVWAASQTEIDPARIAIGGASAGGGLAAGLAITARDRGTVELVLQVLTYPMLDDRTPLRRDVDESGLRLWNNTANRYGPRSYLGVEPGSDAVETAAAPARLLDATGLAPAWMGVGTLDLFHDEDVAYARLLRDAGVPCELEVVDGAFHAFDYLAPGTDVGASFRRSQLGALAAAFGLT